MQYRASIVRWLGGAGRVRRRGGARGARTRLVVKPAWVRTSPRAYAFARPCSVAFWTPRETYVPWRVPSDKYERRDRALNRSLLSVVKQVSFWTGTNLSVHMVHLVDILRSAKVEYPPPVIVSKHLHTLKFNIYLFVFFS